MPRETTVMLKTYRGWRIEVRDDGGQGWLAIIREPQTGLATTLRNRVPQGLEPLLAEARSRVDRETGQELALNW